MDSSNAAPTSVPDQVSTPVSATTTQQQPTIPISSANQPQQTTTPQLQMQTPTPPVANQQQQPQQQQSPQLQSQQQQPQPQQPQQEQQSQQQQQQQQPQQQIQPPAAQQQQIQLPVSQQQQQLQQLQPKSQPAQPYTIASHASIGPQTMVQPMSLDPNSTTPGPTALVILPHSTTVPISGATTVKGGVKSISPATTVSSAPTVGLTTAHVTLARTSQPSSIQLPTNITTHVPNIATIPLAPDHQHTTVQPNIVNRPTTTTLPVLPMTSTPVSIKSEPNKSTLPVMPITSTPVTFKPGDQNNKYICCLVENGARGPVTVYYRATGPGPRPGQLMPTIQRHQMMTPMGIHPVTSQPLGMGVRPAPTIIRQPTFVGATSTATAPSQMTPDDALAKGTSFFHSLLTRVNVKAKKVVMQNLIQALIDGKKTSEEFASALQEELNSGPHTQLVPFLDLSLPHLRQSLNAGITKLPNIRPPCQQEPPKSETTTSPSTSSPNKQQPTAPAAKKKKTPLPPGQKSAYAIKKEAREAKKKEKESLAAQGIKVEPSEDIKESADKTVKPKPDKPKRQDNKKKQEKQLESLSSTLRDDDDVNDVAAMGGVNLAEESQKIMASGAELVGTQIRSCKDEPFLDMTSLATRISRIAKEYNLAEPSKDVVTLISHATQERLKNMVERLGILAEQRSENLKLNPKYEPSSDIKGQVKFLAELDRIEKRRYEEQERELLLRVAKSRSKAEDPEQQKLRQKAKDMQRAEQDEVRQREANETALLAIGPRKKLKTSTTSSISSFSQLSNPRDTKTSLDLRGDIRRIKRVNIRDLQILLELDRTHLDRLIKITAQ